jgi:hypothetical protein
MDNLSQNQTLKFMTTKTTASLFERNQQVSDLGTRDCPRGTLQLRYRMGHGPCPTSVVTTHNAVGLLVELLD